MSASSRREIPRTARDYDPREVVSALQKAIRRSDVDGALYWGYELDKSGYGGWAWKRLRVICSEDIGPGAPGVAADLRALYENAQDAKRNARGGDRSEGVLYFTHALILLATAPKNRVVDWAVWHHDTDHVERREIPTEALDKHTWRGKRKGRGIAHFIDEASRLEPFTGSLEDLEAGYRAQAVRQHVDQADDLPGNPWTSESAPAQMTMDGDA